VPSPLEKRITDLEEESQRLEHEFRIELPKAIGIARDHGDLSENAEYHAARERHAFVKAQLAQIAGQLAKLKSVEVGRIPTDKVGLYSKVTVFDLDTEAETEYELVTGEEADPDAGRISISSPIGKGFAGKEEGDEVSIQVPSGRRNFEISGLVTIHDRQDG
jgi:transcription elongation factor GreA